MQPSPPDWSNGYLEDEKCFVKKDKNFKLLKAPKVNATACSQTGCSGLAPAPELCPYGAPAAATSPCQAFVNKPHLSQL